MIRSRRCKGKRRFVTEMFALVALRQSLPRTTGLRTYHCSKCGDYHLTSKPRRDW